MLLKRIKVSYASDGNHSIRSFTLDRQAPIGLLKRSSDLLLPLDSLEQRLEIPLAETLGTLPLNDLKEQCRTILDWFGKDLQHVPFVIAIDQDP